MKNSTPHNFRLIITGGGTGGHLFPGISLAQAMIRYNPNCQVLFIGTERKMDKAALADLGFATTTIKSQGLMGKSTAAKFTSLLQQPGAIFSAAGIIRKFKPDLVFGVGGYVTGPVILAARLLGIKTCIHEQNSIPGLANRMLAPLVNRIFVSLPGSEKYFPARKTVLSGNPVRREILAAAAGPPHQKQRQPLTLLILGGSQGARSLNSLILEAAAHRLKDLQPPIRIIHQTGELDETHVREQYAGMGITALVQPFFHDMAQIYTQADLVVCRAGATTLAELAVLRKPALLVPYPYAADNHQEINGRYLVAAGGGLMFKQSDLNGVKLGREIGRLLTDRTLLATMSINSGMVAKPDATNIIINECLELATGKVPENSGKILAF